MFVVLCIFFSKVLRELDSKLATEDTVTDMAKGRKQKVEGRRQKAEGKRFTARGFSI